MNVLIKHIGEPQALLLRSTLQQTRFIINFECSECAGTAFLIVMHSPADFDLASIKRQVCGKTLECGVSVDGLYEFKELFHTGREKVVPLGQVGAFEFEGRFTKCLISGEGYVFQVGGMEFVITTELIPGGDLGQFLKIEEGSWVTFKADELRFWVT